MDFQDLSDIWNSANQDREEKVKINARLFKDVSTRRIRSGLWQLKWTNWFEAIVGLFFLNFLLRFTAAHFSEWTLVLPMLLLIGLTLFSLTINGLQLYHYYQINSQYSVLETQKALERLRFYELMEINSLLVIIPLFPIPFFLLVNHWLNVDLSQLQGYILSFTLGSIVIAGILVLILRRFRNAELKESLAFLRELKGLEAG